MFSRLKRLFEQGKLTAASIWNAVQKGWISEEQYFDIVGEEYV